MAKKIDIVCPLCQSKYYKIIYQPERNVSDPVQLYGAASGVRGTQRLVECAECTLLYENPRLPEEDILAGYKAAQEASHDSQFELRANSFYEALLSLSSHLPAQGAKVLDVGSAGGAFLGAAERYGYEAYGLEPCQGLVDAAKARGLKVEQGTIDSHGFEAASFDLVCFWDVLEHVTDPVAAVKAATALLKPNGLLLINYPDIGTWAARIAGKRFWWILSCHLTHFTQHTIRELCYRTDMQVELFKPYWQTLELGYLFKMADHLGVPLAGLVGRSLPESLSRKKVRYWASQTTALIRRKEGK